MLQAIHAANYIHVGESRDGRNAFYSLGFEKVTSLRANEAIECLHLVPMDENAVNLDALSDHMIVEPSTGTIYKWVSNGKGGAWFDSGYSVEDVAIVA